MCAASTEARVELDRRIQQQSTICAKGAVFVCSCGAFGTHNMLGESVDALADTVNVRTVQSSGSPVYDVLVLVDVRRERTSSLI